MKSHESKKIKRDYQFIRALHCVDGQTKGRVGGNGYIEF